MRLQRGNQPEGPPRLVRQAWFLVELVVVLGFAFGLIVAIMNGAGAWTVGGGMAVILAYIALVLGRR